MKAKKELEIPAEVMEVMAIYCFAEAVGGVGSKTFERVQEIINKYPKWFPWEHKYKKIPMEVHEAYRKEKYGFDISDHGEWRDKEPGKGLMQMIEENAKVMEFTISDKPIETLLDEAWNEMERVRLKQIEDEKIDKALWDKHYKKYNLEYRK